MTGPIPTVGPIEVTVVREVKAPSELSIRVSADHIKIEKAKSPKSPMSPMSPLKALMSQEEAAAIIQKHTRGVITRTREVSKLVTAKSSAAVTKFKSIFVSGHYWGKPVHSSIKEALAINKEGRSNYEYLRDEWLLLMLRVQPCLLVVCLAGMIGVVVAGLLLVVMLFPVQFGVDMGWMTELRHPYCNTSQFNETWILTDITSSYPPQVINIDVNVLGKNYVAHYCTYAQTAFNNCIKYFTIYFTFINLLPLPWTIAIFVDARERFARGKYDTVGTDFYDRPTEAIWFFLPAGTRRKISLWLLFAVFAQILALVCHIVWWSYISGQTFPGVLMQNVWLVLQFAALGIAGSIQGKAENKVREEYPGRFPPTIMHYLEGAYREWKAKANEDGKIQVSEVCGCSEHSFIQYVLKEMKEFKKQQDELKSEQKVDALTGIVIHSSRRRSQESNTDEPSDKLRRSNTAAF